MYLFLGFVHGVSLRVVLTLEGFGMYDVDVAETLLTLLRFIIVLGM